MKFKMFITIKMIYKWICLYWKVHGCGEEELILMAMLQTLLKQSKYLNQMDTRLLLYR